MNKRITYLLFVILLLTVSSYYNYHRILLKRPQSTHVWRQTDNAAIALNYYQHGMHFFQQETQNLTSDNETSSYCRTSEVPVLYYTVAALYKIFGPHEVIFRFLNMFIFLLGLFYLFRLFNYVLKDNWWATLLALFLFTSPLLVFYGNNFLSNTTALSLSIIAWYHIIRYFAEKHFKFLVSASLLFLLAASMQITALFSVFALLGILLLELIGIKILSPQTQIFKHKTAFIVFMLVIISLPVIWIISARHYNLKHDCSYFSTHTFPLWELSDARIARVIENVKTIWIQHYFHSSALFFIGIAFLFIIFRWKQSNRFYLLTSAILLLELITYVLLQFMQFADHDYYLITAYVFPVIILLGSFSLLKNHYPKLYSSKIAKVIFSVFVILNIYHAGKMQNERYQGWMNNYKQMKDIYSITPYLRQIGISKDDKVISIPDKSHASLYLMNQKGWTEYVDMKFYKSEKVAYNRDSIGIQKSIDRGAKFLIINGIEQLYQKPYLQPYSTNMVGKYNGVYIFNLQDTTRNFDPNARKIEQEWRCDAETLNKEGTHFMNTKDSSLFEYGNLRTSDESFAGNYSCRLNKNAPFGMTIRISNLKVGQSFNLSVKKKSVNPEHGSIVASCEAASFYTSTKACNEIDKDGWGTMLLDFFIDGSLNNQEITIYLHNPNAEYVYFDDLKITKYQQIIPNDILQHSLTTR